jgi:hypothetical protein
VVGVGATITRRHLPTDLVRGVGHGAERACRGLRCVESGLRRRLSDAARQAWVTARRGDDVHLREDDRREFVDASLTLDEVGSLGHGRFSLLASTHGPVWSCSGCRNVRWGVAGRFPKIVQETALVASEGLEERIKELMGEAYRTPEERAARGAELVEALAAKRALVGQATGGRRSDYVDVTPAEKKQAARDEAVAIRVENGGAPAQVRGGSGTRPCRSEKSRTQDSR